MIESFTSQCLHVVRKRVTADSKVESYECNIQSAVATVCLSPKQKGSHKNEAEIKKEKYKFL